jgi:hypothetical protein
VEDTKPAAISFGRAAYVKKPAPENTQIVAAVAANAKLEPRGPHKGWPKFTEGGKRWSLCTQEERDAAIFKWADYSHWREHGKGRAEGHYCQLEYGMVQSRYIDHSAYMSASSRGFESDTGTQNAYEVIRARKRSGLLFPINKDARIRLP